MKTTSTKKSNVKPTAPIENATSSSSIETDDDDDNNENKQANKQT
jgi:hypothetical protein